MAEIAIGISGCGGRMGRMLIAEVQATDGCRVAGGIEAVGNPVIGRDLGALAGVGMLGAQGRNRHRPALRRRRRGDRFHRARGERRQRRRRGAREKAAGGRHHWGFEPAHEAALAAAAREVAIVHAANMSLGVNLLLGLVGRVAATLGEDYDIEILEMHHRHKVDAPSGTALALGRAAAAARGIDLGARGQRVRDGITGPRRAGDIGFATLRGGDVVGEHSVIFAADGERIELSHRAGSRRIFARGAVRAARWLASSGPPPGLYGMADVLGLD